MAMTTNDGDDRHDHHHDNDAHGGDDTQAIPFQFGPEHSQLATVLWPLTCVVRSPMAETTPVLSDASVAELADLEQATL